ncbi:MAG: Calx-beta domain-containing protein [Pseudanabaenaceae cyanobacterium SKYGB_i_bin29]|nr:hypothetical protein [Pseudanabaenaceae cyanobacterium SKYG29]MDW8422562.1 Calx-beta domain-containing protein [Pseudanabaenaceae cyanobacterium SKYGB_i_bin29]
MAIINGTPGNDVLVGTPEDDVIRGLDGNDIISGLDGNDQLDGGAGNDSIAGNKGNDSLFGGAGDDTLYGGQDNDLVIGEAGNDIIGGEAGVNTLTGGVGRDRFVLTTSGTATVTDFFAGDDFLVLSGDLTIDDVEVSQSFANTLVIDRRTGNVLATLNNVNAGDLRRQNFLDANGRPVSFAPTAPTIVDVTATDPIARATNPDDPIVFTISRTNTTGDLTVNFTLTTTPGVTLQSPPTSVRIPNGQTFANVPVTPQATSRDGTVTLTIQDSPNYDVRVGVATGTVSAPVTLPTPAPQPAPPDAPPVVDLVLVRSDIPTRPAEGERAVALFNVFNRGTGRADRVVFELTVPVDSDVVRVEPSQGVFTGFSGDNARTGIIKVELGSIDPNREATIRVTYVPKTTGNFLSSNARVTSAQPDVDPSNNFANANLTVVPSPPNLPVVSVVASEDGIAQEPDTTQLEKTDREETDSRGRPTGLVTREFIFRRTGGDLSKPLTVNYTLDGTAQNGVDFEPIGSSVIFAPFQTEVRVTIRPVQDQQVEDTEFVRLTLVPNPLVFRVDETRGENTARINIRDVANPVGPRPLPGTVVSIVAMDNFADEFRPPSASGGSTPGIISPIRGVLRVTRDNTIGDLEVRLEVSGTANRPDEPGSDYLLFDTLGRAIPVSGGVARIVIPDGQRFIDVYLEAVDDDRSEGDEDALFNLAPDPNNFYVIGRPQDVAADRPALIRIRDNETPPNVRIDVVSGRQRGEEATQTPIVFRVSRTGDVSAPRAVVVEMVRQIRIIRNNEGQEIRREFEPGTAGRPRQIQRNGPFDSDGEDYTITGPTVFLGESNLTSFLGIANLSQFQPELTSNRFLVIIPAGQSSVEFFATPINDGTPEGVETVIARIVPPPFPGVPAGGPVAPSDIPPQGFIVVGGAAEGFIIDDDREEAVVLSNQRAVAVEGAAPGILRVSRTGSTDRAVTVPLVAISFAEGRESRLVGLPADPQIPFPAEPVLLTAPQIAVPLFITFGENQRVISFEATTRVSDAAPSGRVAEADLKSTLSIARSGDISRPLTIPGTVVETLRSTGFPGVTLTVDVDIPSSVVIPPGQSFVDVPVVATTDNTFEGIESLAVIINYETLPIVSPGYRPAGNPQIFFVTDEGINLILGTVGGDTLSGTGGADVIVGGLGNDVLTGGAGPDQFVFNSPFEGVDTITDLDPSFDSIRISQAGFGGGLGFGTLPAAAFIAGLGQNTANDADDRFIYNTSNGQLRFDPDGTGPLAPVLLATLSGLPNIAATNIVIF